MELREQTDFGKLLAGVASDYDKRPSADATMRWWQVLSPYTLEAVRGALNAAQRMPAYSRSMPTPGQVVAIIEASNPRAHPAPDVAYAMLPADETQTALWTDEMAAAWAVAVPVSGDRNAHRMAFRSAYERLLTDAAANDRPAQWRVSPGFDADGRLTVVQRGLNQRILTYEQALALLPFDDKARLIPLPGSELMAVGVRSAAMLEGPATDAEVAGAAEAKAAVERVADHARRAYAQRATGEQRSDPEPAPTTPRGVVVPVADRLREIARHGAAIAPAPSKAWAALALLAYMDGAAIAKSRFDMAVRAVNLSAGDVKALDDARVSARERQ